MSLYTLLQISKQISLQIPPKCKNILTNISKYMYLQKFSPNIAPKFEPEKISKKLQKVQKVSKKGPQKRDQTGVIVFGSNKATLVHVVQKTNPCYPTVSTSICKYPSKQMDLLRDYCIILLVY